MNAFPVRLITSDSPDHDLRAMIAAAWNSYLQTLVDHAPAWQSLHHLDGLVGASTELRDRMMREHGIF